MPKLRPWLVVTGLCLIYALWVAADDPLRLVSIGTRFSEAAAQENAGAEGYDGQFVYYIARDPLTAEQFLDVPAYRFQRILLPALAMPFPDDAIPFVLLAVNLIGLAVGTFIMERLLVEQGVGRWYALAYGLTLGTFGATRLSLTEPLAYGLALAGVWLAARERPLLSAVLFALAALTKETALVVAAGYGLYLLANRHWRDAVLFGVIALAPFIVWQIVLYTHLGAFGVGSGGALATSFEIVPFMGVIRIITEGAFVALEVSGISQFLVIILTFSIVVGVFVLVPTIWGLKRVVIDFRARKVSLYTWLLLTTCLIMAFVPFSTYREPVGILRFIVGLQIAVLLYAGQQRNTRVLHNSMIWIFTVFFVVMSDFAG